MTSVWKHLVRYHGKTVADPVFEVGICHGFVVFSCLMFSDFVLDPFRKYYGVYFPMQIIVLLDNQSYSILPVQKRYYFGIGIERKVLISKYSSSNFVMQI